VAVAEAVVTARPPRAIAPPASTAAQRISLWVSAVFGGFLLLAFLLMPGFFPPMSPRMSAQATAAYYADHTSRIRASMIIFNVCAIMLIPLFTVIVHQMKRMATDTQVLAYCYLSAVTSGATLLAIADLFWLIAAFRPDRDPNIIQMLNDFAWIVFTAPVGMIVGQCLCIAIAVWLDKHAVPIFPKWVAPFCVLIAALMVPAAAAAAVQTGPLAWNGFISFWLRVVSYGTFLVVMFFVLRGAIRREQADIDDSANDGAA
jgi:hypothetical protein